MATGGESLAAVPVRVVWQREKERTRKVKVRAVVEQVPAESTAGGESSG